MQNSSTPSNSKRTCGIIAIAVTSLLGLCCAGSLIINALGGDVQPTEDINLAIHNIYSTMTMEAAVKSRYIELTQEAPTAEPLPTETPELIPTLAPTAAPTLAPTQTPFPTSTPVPILPTQPSAPTAPPQSVGVCDCGRDYNCSDFSTHNAAQACYDSCGGNNWAGLDSDIDGIACESLP